MSLNVGIVTEYCYPLLGGISENVYHTATELQARGHRVTVITSTPALDHSAQLAMPNGVPIVRIGRGVTFSGNGAKASATIGGVRLWNDLRAALRAQRFDILQLHSPLNPTLPPLAALQGPWPRVGTFHSYFDHSLVYAILKKVLQREFLRRLNGVTVVSPSVALALSRYFDFKASVIPNGIDTRQFHPNVPRFDRFSTDKRTLLFLGHLVPRNGLPFMLRVFTLVRRQVGDVRLVVVGLGDRRAFEALVPDRLRPEVHFEGPALLDRPRYYGTADVFCSPVSRASFGITVLEAMATATPIVATDNIGYRDLLEPEEGVLVPENEERFASVVVELLADDRRRRAMGAAGRQKAERYAWPVVVSSLLEYFHEIISKS